ncbi:MAG: hypothetical protein OWQ48_05310 [Desulfurococcus sp.]|nr:hypothetical protein [Desulfurococcus sp.]
MQKRPLVIAVYEPRWFIRVLDILRERGVYFTHYYSSSEVPYGSVVYTDHPLFLREASERKDLLVVYDPGHECVNLEKAILASHLKEQYSELVVGVDPGRRLGYIVIGDGEYVMHGSGDYVDLLNTLSYVASCIPAGKLVVRVGSKHKGVETALLIRKDTGLRVEVVDEDDTTPNPLKTGEMKVFESRLRRVKPYREKDVYAAYKIALKKGVEVG